MERELFIRQLYQAAVLLGRLGRPGSGLALLDRIVREDDGWQYQKLRLETALGQGDLDAAERILRDIDRRDPAAEIETEWLETRRHRIVNRPVVISRVHGEITARRPRATQPVAGRILYVLNNSLPYSTSGYATRSHGLARGLRAAGHEVICLTRPGFPHDTLPAGIADLPACDLVDGIAYHRIDTPSYRSHAGNGYVMLAAEAIMAKLQEFRPELVMAASNHLTSLPAQIAAARLGIPFIYEVRGFWEITRASREPEFMNTPAFAAHAELETLSAGAADHVFTLTSAMSDELIARGVDGARITLLPNSCMVDDFLPRKRDAELAAQLGIADDVPVIGYVGSFVQYEGLDDLARAAAMLKQRGLEFRLLLVGDETAPGMDKGPVTAAIEAAGQGLCDWLIMPGRVPYEMAARYYSLIDIAPFPRKAQPVTEMVSPLKPLEAMAIGKPVLVSSVRALSEMVQDEETGLLFEKGNVDALADGLHRLIADAALRARIGAAGRAWVERERNWPVTAAVASEEIRRVLANDLVTPPLAKAGLPR